MTRRYEVLVVGELNVDLILNGLHKFPELGKEVLADEMTLALGSSSAIFASNLSSLGVSVALAGSVGNDLFGKYILEKLRDRGVSTDYITISETKGTGATIALNEKEERAAVTFPGTMSDFGIKQIDKTVFDKAGHLHVSSIFLQPEIRKDIVPLFSMAKEKGLTTSLDPQWDPAEKWDVDLLTLLNYVDVFLPNAAELRAMTGTENILSGLELLKGTASTIVVKNGSEGAVLWCVDKYIEQPAFVNANVVDSIGAGDSFNAGFISKFIRGEKPDECLKYGALMGAINTTDHGGTAAFDNPASLKLKASSLFNYTI